MTYLRFLACRCLEFPDCADFHPLMFVDGVIDAFVRRGGRVHERTRVVNQTILDGRQVGNSLLFAAHITHCAVCAMHCDHSAVTCSCGHMPCCSLLRMLPADMSFVDVHGLHRVNHSSSSCKKLAAHA